MTSLRTTLLVVTGPPGAGKSSVAELIVDRFPKSVLVPGDTFFEFLRRDAIDPWLVEAHEQNESVVAASALATGAFVAGGFMTVFDGMVGPWFLPAFARGVGVHRLHYAVLLPTVERCLERIGARLGHGFRDQDATRHMHAAFVRADIDPRYVIVNEHNDAATAAQEILRRFERDELSYAVDPH